MKRPYSSITYTILALVLAYSIGADFWMQKNGVPFGVAYLGPLFFIGIIVLYVLAIEASTVVPEKPDAGAAPETDEPSNSIECCALLVYDKSSEGSFSAAWMNTLGACYGPYSVAAPGDALGKAAEGKTVIVIPSRETASVIKDKASAEALFALAAKGASIIIEAPSPEAAALIGAGPEGSAVSAPPSWTYPGVIPDGSAQALAGCPIRIQFKSRECHRGGYATWMRAGDHPAIVGKAVGAGGVIITLFEYSRYITGLKQGSAEAGFAAAVTGAPSYKLASPELFGNTVPFADIFDSFISGLASHFSPSASWWPHPGGAKSSLILACEDDGVGRRLGVALDVFSKAGASPTVFLSAGSRNLKDSAAAVSGRSFTPALLWNRFSSSLISDNNKTKTPNTLSAQAGRVNEVIANSGSVKTARAMRLRWDGAAEDNFELMRAAGVENDCSFGPGPREKGYIFATGFPFHPLTASGEPAKILEIPFQLDASRPASSQFAAGLIENATAINSPAAATFKARRQIQDGRARETAKDILESAAANGLNLLSADAFASFWKSRAASPLSAVREGSILKIVAVAHSDGLFLRLPATMRGAGTLSSVTLDGSTPAPSSVIDGALLSLTKGSHNVVLTYSKSEAPE